MKRVILVEDNKIERENIAFVLSHIDNVKLVNSFCNGADALSYLDNNDVVIVITDIQMPEMDGIEVVKRMRKNGITTPTLFLTAKTEIEQRIEGLDAGADDYLPKPFSTGELLARVRAMLRRKDNFTPEMLTFGAISLNRSTYELVFEEKRVSLRGKEFQVMEMLMQRPNMLVTTEQLMTHIWGWDTSVDTSVVWVHISNIRKKLDAMAAPIAIKFVRNAGYILGARE